MRRWTNHLAGLGRVVPFDYPYVLAGRKSPDRLPELIAAHQQALAQASRRSDDVKVLIGKSMGSRVGCHVAADEPDILALVCLGYPLRGSSGVIRDEALLALQSPILFVQGSHDVLCPLGDLERVRKKMSAESSVYVVDGGNHSLEVGQRQLREDRMTQAEVESRALEAIRVFLKRWA